MPGVWESIGGGILVISLLTFLAIVAMIADGQVFGIGLLVFPVAGMLWSLLPLSVSAVIRAWHANTRAVEKLYEQRDGGA